MKSRLLLLLALTLSAAACKNPADGVPAATTSAPTEEHAAAATAEGSEAAAPAEGSVVEAAVVPDEEPRVIEIKPGNASVGFIGSKVTASHEGSFGEFSGKVTVGATIPESSVEVVVQTASLVVPDEDRLTSHLRSADFLDVETFPTATFVSSSITQAEGDTYNVVGLLEMHGMKQEISFPAQIALSDAGLSMSTQFSIKRQEFGIVYPGMPDDLIRDEVVLKITINGAN